MSSFERGARETLLSLKETILDYFEARHYAKSLMHVDFDDVSFGTNPSDGSGYMVVKVGHVLYDGCAASKLCPGFLFVDFLERGSKLTFYKATGEWRMKSSITGRVYAKAEFPIFAADFVSMFSSAYHAFVGSHFGGPAFQPEMKFASIQHGSDSFKEKAMEHLETIRRSLLDEFEARGYWRAGVHMDLSFLKQGYSRDFNVPYVKVKVGRIIYDGSSRSTYEPLFAFDDIYLNNSSIYFTKTEHAEWVFGTTFTYPNRFLMPEVHKFAKIIVDLFDQAYMNKVWPPE